MPGSVVGSHRLTHAPQLPRSGTPLSRVGSADMFGSIQSTVHLKAMAMQDTQGAGPRSARMGGGKPVHGGRPLP